MKIDSFSALSLLKKKWSAAGGGKGGRHGVTRTLIFVGLALLPLQAPAQPVTLKLSFFSSDTEVNYARH
ncbi:hypothetical protein ACF1BQ_019225 [Bradyrhizobium sp. RDT10]